MSSAIWRDNAEKLDPPVNDEFLESISLDPFFNLSPNPDPLGGDPGDYGDPEDLKGSDDSKDLESSVVHPAQLHGLRLSPERLPPGTALLPVHIPSPSKIPGQLRYLLALPGHVSQSSGHKQGDMIDISQWIRSSYTLDPIEPADDTPTPHELGHAALSEITSPSNRFPPARIPPPQSESSFASKGHSPANISAPFHHSVPRRVAPSHEARPQQNTRSVSEPSPSAAVATWSESDENAASSKESHSPGSAAADPPHPTSQSSNGRNPSESEMALFSFKKFSPPTTATSSGRARSSDVVRSQSQRSPTTVIHTGVPQGFSTAMPSSAQSSSDNSLSSPRARVIEAQFPKRMRDLSPLASHQISPPHDFSNNTSRSRSGGVHEIARAPYLPYKSAAQLPFIGDTGNPKFPTLAGLGVRFEGPVDILSCSICSQALTRLHLSSHNPFQGFSERTAGHSTTKDSMGPGQGPMLWRQRRMSCPDDLVISSCGRCGDVWHRFCIMMYMKGAKDHNQQPTCPSCGDGWEDQLY